MRESGRPRRPTFMGPEGMEAHGGVIDPTAQIEAAHETARVLVHTGRATNQPELTERLVHLVEDLGIETVAELWASRPARSLPGSLWRLYVLREWVVRQPEQAAHEYAAGIRFAEVNHAVAGVADPPGPQQVGALVDEILRGVFAGDLGVALDRAAAFARVVSAGRADGDDGEKQAVDAANMLAMATDLSACADLWRSGELH